MPQIFHRSFNTIGRVAVFGSLMSVAGLGLGLAVFFRSDYATGMHTAYIQPVPFSHAHHTGQLGIDCRYCHTSVEVSPFAGLPPTKTCMNCHQQMWVGSEMLQPVRDSYRDDQSLPWQRVHNLPGFVYFNHSIHISKGVGCATCHGRLDEMPLTWQVNTLLMEWCVECHRNPEPNLRPKSEVFSMVWNPSQKTADPDHPGEFFPQDQASLGAELKKRYNVREVPVLTSCSTCHR
jgi:hypothetical protein